MTVALNIHQCEICPLLITDVKSKLKTTIAQSSAAKVTLCRHSFQESSETKQILRLVFFQKKFRRSSNRTQELYLSHELPLLPNHCATATTTAFFKQALNVLEANSSDERSSSFTRLFIID